MVRVTAGALLSLAHGRIAVERSSTWPFPCLCGSCTTHWCTSTNTLVHALEPAAEN